MSANALVGIAGSTPTAPGNPLTNLADALIASMPAPMTISGPTSKPTGIKTSVARAAGMITTLQMRHYEKVGQNGVVLRLVEMKDRKWRHRR